MSITGWSNLSGTPSPITNSPIYVGGTVQLVAPNASTINVYELLNADLSPVITATTTIPIYAVSWIAVFSVTVPIGQSPSQFGGNPVREKLGIYALSAGIYSGQDETIKYRRQITQVSQFFWSSSAPEASTADLVLLPAPISYGAIITPNVGFNFIANFGQEFRGITRLNYQVSLPYIVGIRVTYTATIYANPEISSTAPVLISNQ